MFKSTALFDVNGSCVFISLTERKRMLEKMERFRTKLAEAGATVVIRGAGSARFVLAEHQGRAIEASLNDDAWWIEFWEADNDADAPPVGEKTFIVDAEALQVAIAWLNCRREPF